MVSANILSSSQQMISLMKSSLLIADLCGQDLWIFLRVSFSNTMFERWIYLQIALLKKMVQKAF